MKHNVTIYTTPTCHFCHAAKEFLNENKITYTEKNISTDQEALKEMVEKSGQMGVPVINVDDKYLIGFDKSALKELLDLNGE